MTALRRYRRQSQAMGQTSPPVLVMPVLMHIVGSEVADIGCGSGMYGYVMRTAWQFTGAWHREDILEPSKLIGVDWSARSVELLSERRVYDDVLLAGSDRLPLEDHMVDTAISVENLEHLLPSEVPLAIGELARIARRQVVISTPAPWAVVNQQFLATEIAEAENDPHPLGYPEFMNLLGNLHKSSVWPEQMEAAGFDCRRNRVGAVPTFSGSVIYTAEPNAIQPDRLGPIAGYAQTSYPHDDGREDWRDAYLEALHDNRAIPARSKPPARQPLSEIARTTLNGLRLLTRPSAGEEVRRPAHRRGA